MSNQDTINTAGELSQRVNMKVKYAMDSILIDMVNWIKDNHTHLDGWKNRTHQLENSIKEVLSTFDPSTQSLVGFVTAGPLYALFLEYKPFHWVLSGGMNEFKGKILTLMKERIEAQG